MSSYPTKKLGEVCEIVTGSTPRTSVTDYYGGHILWAGPTDLDQGDYVVNTQKRLTQRGIIEGGARLVPKNSVMVSCIGNIGKVAIASEEMATNQQVNTFFPKIKELDSKFLFYTLILKSDEFKKLSSQTTLPIINKTKCSNIKIPLPPLAEQKKIVAKLEKNLEKIKKAKELNKQAQELASQLLPSELHKFFEEGKKNGWEKKELGELFEITSSKRVFKSEWREFGVPFYRAREIVSLAKNKPFKTPIFISEDMYEQYKEKYGVPKVGDVLATGVGTLGITYLVKDSDKFYFKDGNIIWLKKISDVISEYIEYFFKSDCLKEQVNEYAGGATVRTFTIKTANIIKIPLPPLEEQKKMVKRLDSISEKVKDLQKHQKTTEQNLESLEQSILSKVFSLNPKNYKYR